MRTLQAVVIGSQQRVAPPLLPLGLGPSLEQFLGLLFVQLEFAPDRLGIATIKAVLGKLLLLRQPDVAIRLIVRPTQVVYVLPPLQKLADTLEPVSQLHRNRVEVEAPTLLKVGELRNFKSVEQNLPADPPSPQSGRFPVVLLKPYVVLAQIDSDHAEALQIDLLNVGWGGFENHLKLRVLIQPVGILPIPPVGRPTAWLHVGNAIGRRPKHPQERH